jgi:hypothetical protein
LEAYREKEETPLGEHNQSLAEEIERDYGNS